MAITGGRTSGRRRVKFNQHTNTRTNIDSLVTSMNGRRLKVDYFNKQVTEDETVIPFDINQSGHLANFNRIADLKINVVTEIPIDANINEIEGSATIMVEGLLPTIGDVFLLTLPGNVTALMNVKEVDRKSYNNKEVYEIQYRALELLTTDEKVEEFVASMTGALIEDLVYDDEHQVNGTSPLITRSDLTKLHKLQRDFSELSAHLIDVINVEDSGYPFHKSSKGFLLDTNISNFINRIISSTDYDVDDSIVEVDLDERLYKTILDLLLDECGVHRIYMFNRFTSDLPLPISEDARMATFLSHGMVEKHNVPHYDRDYKCDYVLPDFEVDNFIDKELDYVSSNVVEFPKLFGETYIFSKAFYNVTDREVCNYDEFDEAIDVAVTFASSKTTSTSLNTGNGNDNQDDFTEIEKAVYSQIRDGVVEIDTVDNLITASYHLNRTDTIYFVPIILLLAKTFLLNRADAF